MSSDGPRSPLDDSLAALHEIATAANQSAAAAAAHHHHHQNMHHGSHPQHPLALHPAGALDMGGGGDVRKRLKLSVGGDPQSLDGLPLLPPGAAAAGLQGSGGGHGDLFLQGLNLVSAAPSLHLRVCVLGGGGMLHLFGHLGGGVWSLHLGREARAHRRPGNQAGTARSKRPRRRPPPCAFLRRARRRLRCSAPAAGGAAAACSTSTRCRRPPAAAPAAACSTRACWASCPTCCRAPRATGRRAGCSSAPRCCSTCSTPRRASAEPRGTACRCVRALRAGRGNAARGWGLHSRAVWCGCLKPAAGTLRRAGGFRGERRATATRSSCPRGTAGTAARTRSRACWRPACQALAHTVRASARALLGTRPGAHARAREGDWGRRCFAPRCVPLTLRRALFHAARRWAGAGRHARGALPGATGTPRPLAST